MPHTEAEGKGHYKVGTASPPAARGRKAAPAKAKKAKAGGPPPPPAGAPPVGEPGQLDPVPGGCVLCHLPDFQLEGFGSRTIIICDQARVVFWLGSGFGGARAPPATAGPPAHPLPLRFLPTAVRARVSRRLPAPVRAGRPARAARRRAQGRGLVRRAAARVPPSASPTATNPTPQATGSARPSVTASPKLCAGWWPAASGPWLVRTRSPCCAAGTGRARPSGPCAPRPTCWPSRSTPFWTA